MHGRPRDEFRDWTRVELNGLALLAGLVLAALTYGPICLAYAGLRRRAALCKASAALRTRPAAGSLARRLGPA